MLQFFVVLTSFLSQKEKPFSLMNRLNIIMCYLLAKITLHLYIIYIHLYIHIVSLQKYIRYMYQLMIYHRFLLRVLNKIKIWYTSSMYNCINMQQRFVVLRVMVIIPWHLWCPQCLLLQLQLPQYAPYCTVPICTILYINRFFL